LCVHPANEKQIPSFATHRVEPVDAKQQDPAAARSRNPQPARSSLSLRRLSSDAHKSAALCSGVDELSNSLLQAISSCHEKADCDQIRNPKPQMISWHE